MVTQITATLPTLDFPLESDYPTQEDWAAFSAAAELNFGILGGSWSTQMQLWKTQANAMSLEMNNNADLAQSIAYYQGDWTSKGYSLGQTVSVGGIYYVCKLTHATAQNPTTAGSLYWNLVIGNWNLKVNTDMSGYTSKTTPVDADLIPLSDSATSFGIKKLSLANLKSNLKTYFNRSIVAGTVRQDPTDRTKWLFISDSEHTPIGVSGTYGVATGNSLVINFDKTYSKVISFVIAPDETLARSMGMIVGASVGLDKVTVNASVHTNIVAKIYWNGTTWVIENLDGQNGNVQVSSYINGSLTIAHTYCKGASYSLNAWTQGNAIYPYIPILRSTGEDSVSIFFMDTTTGQFVATPTPSTKMSFVFSKQSNTRQIRLDGTDSATIINNVDITSGNFWFYGIFEE